MTPVLWFLLGLSLGCAIGPLVALAFVASLVGDGLRGLWK
jgi:hypothetical protein